MRKLIVDLLKYILYWLIYFWLSKMFFLLFNYNITHSLTISEISGIFFIGAKMDLSMASYLTVLPSLLFAFSFLFSPRVLKTVIKAYTYLLLIPVTFLNIIDLGLYPHWGTRVNIRAFDYIGDPKGIIANIIWTDVLLVIIISTLYYFVFTWLFRKFFTVNFQQITTKKWFLTPIALFITASLIIPIRGGFGTAPLNASSVSFSNKLYVNQSASNYLWNFANSAGRRKSFVNPCIFTSSDEAMKIFQSTESQRTHSDSSILNLQGDAQPNVLLIILESFSDKIISALGGTYNVCPNLDSLCHESVVFSSFYASGNRSDRGISAILGGYPSLLDMSIMRFSEKSDKLTLMPNYFNQHNYHSSFYYGGDINFYNLKSFILQGEFDDITSNKNFDRQLQRMSKWGVPDGYLFDRVLADIEQKKQPFFTTAYTLSSHPPYDVPFNKIEGQSMEAKYLNSVAYTDSCLGEFIRAFRKTEYWKNTLVIITADHGSIEPGPTEIIAPDTYRIPLIWTGGVIKDSIMINNTGSQVDLISTLINQLGWKKDSLLFGHDLFSLPSYAFYMQESGWGYITSEGEYFYDINSGKIKTFKQTEKAQPDFEFSKAYLQVLHDDFLSK